MTARVRRIAISTTTAAAAAAVVGGVGGERGDRGDTEVMATTFLEEQMKGKCRWRQAAAAAVEQTARQRTRRPHRPTQDIHSCDGSKGAMPVPVAAGGRQGAAAVTEVAGRRANGVMMEMRTRRGLQSRLRQPTPMPTPAPPQQQQQGSVRLSLLTESPTSTAPAAATAATTAAAGV